MKFDFRVESIMGNIRVLKGCLIVWLCVGLAVAHTASADEYKDAKKAHEQGNDNEALELLIIKLTDDNDHQKAVQLFKIVFKSVVDGRTKKAERYTQQERWDKACKEYRALDRVNRFTKHLSIYEKVDGKKQLVNIPLVDVAGLLEHTKTQAADAYYNAGLALMNSPGQADKVVETLLRAGTFIPDYKDSNEMCAQAYYQDALMFIDDRDYKAGITLLRKAQKFVPDYADTEEKIAESTEAAMQRIALMPFENLSGKNTFGYIGGNLTDQSIAVAVSKNPEFLRFVTREYIYQVLREQQFEQSRSISQSTAVEIGKLAGIYAFVFGKVLSITVNYPLEQTEQGYAEKTFRNYETDAIYTRRARWQKHTRMGKVTVRCSFQIVNVTTGRIEQAKRLSETYETRAQWVTYTGDENALDQEVLSHNTTGDVPIEPQEVLVEHGIASLASTIAKRLIYYFK